jgi:hypothetical protein
MGFEHIYSFTRDIMYESHELSNSFLLLKVVLVGNAAVWLGWKLATIPPFLKSIRSDYTSLVG